MEQLFEIVSHPKLQPIFITWAVFFLVRICPLPSHINPFTALHFLGTQLAKKVSPSKKEGINQHYISGTLAVIMLVVPFILIVLILLELAYYPWFFDALILYICLSRSVFLTRAKRVSIALKQGKMSLAKNILSNIVLRQTSTLSAIGIAKASVETVFLRTLYQQVVVMFWFILIGPLVALAYCMCLECHASWNQKYVAYKRFGRPVWLICECFQWIPVRIAILLGYIVTRGFSGMSKINLSSMANFLCRESGYVILQVYANAIQASLSGPVIYSELNNEEKKVNTTEHKIRRTRFVQQQECNHKHVLTAIDISHRTLISFMMLMTLFSSAIYGVFI